jgi:hypothetical protein
MCPADRNSEANTKTIRIKSRPAMSVTLSCGNLFLMAKEDRTFVMELLDVLEDYDEKEGRGDGA